MAKIGKWITGALGWFVGGPVGAIIGFALGAMLEHNHSEEQQTPPSQPHTQRPYTQQKNTEEQNRNGFMASLLVLMAAIAKADGAVMKSELNYIKNFLAQRFGASATQEALVMLRDILKQPMPLQDVCTQIRQQLNIASRREILYLLFGVAAADGSIHTKELDVLQRITNYLGLSSADYESIKAMFIKQDSHWAYRVLEIHEQASNEDVKKAYRRMALKHHPDKVANMGEEIQKAAGEKFNQIKEAYDYIIKTRQ